jgi:DNA-3-methyladenine glycosylase
LAAEPVFARIEAAAFPVGTASLAQALIGSVLVRDGLAGRAAGRIVETEAYPPGDVASHAFRGRRQRNASMFLGPLHAYVYFIYGMHYCVNVSSEPEGVGGAVLLRALEPVAGIAAMRLRRGCDKEADLCRGPACLARALDIDRSLDGCLLVNDARLWLAAPDRPVGAIGATQRIGVGQARSARLRWYERGNPCVSGPRALSPA